MKNNKIDNNILNQTKKLVELFLNNEYPSDIELSKMTGIPASTVGRRLTNEFYMTVAFGEKGAEIYQTIKEKRQENLLRGKSLGGQTSMLNNIPLKDENGKFIGSTKLRLDIFSNDVLKQYKILAHAALYFRLHIDTLSQLFQIDEKELLDKLLSAIPGGYDGLKFLFYHDNIDQEQAREKFINYYRDFLIAEKQKNKQEKIRLIQQVDDAKAITFKKARITNVGKPISNDEIEILMRYQLKTAVTFAEMERIFGIDRSHYKKRVEKLLNQPEYEDLNLLFENLIEYADRYQGRRK